MASCRKHSAYTQHLYVQSRGFIEAGNLLVGDKLISVNGEDLVIEKFFIEETAEPVDVYNLQVEDYHTYFVGDCAVWVHNAECGGSYKDVKKKNAEENHGKAKRDPKDAHHMPAHDAYPDYVKTRIGNIIKKLMVQVFQWKMQIIHKQQVMIISRVPKHIERNKKSLFRLKNSKKHLIWMLLI